ncbi:hypothetical protein Rsub_09402 [Raphidocelis subcapitata]|uniref:Vacuolar protein-sorting-associated protein 36 n=1 Tax=Raphidocelis subcapitata TaxID=307507 RepID=A0A2V0PBM3_9CHLO|nr:hypothetical protein Rsub_09402 [Raphidocelis subcapitata]|eukprot:GBF96332.1 hypothetical protein Rsub_09402 [Raphidocelis subcapitata]
MRWSARCWTRWPRGAPVDVEFEGSGAVEGEAPADRYQGGYAIVTSHRLLWIDAASAPSPGRSCALHLAAVQSAVKRAQYGFNPLAPKVRLELRVHINAEARPCPAHESFRFVSLALRCRGPAPDAFLEAVAAGLAQQRLAAQAAAQAAAAAAAAAAQQPGGAGRSQQRSLVGVPGGAAGAVTVGDAPGALRVSATDADASYLRAIVDMGFSRNVAARALVATHNEGVQAALDWVLAYGDAPGADDPLEGEEAAAAATPGAAAAAAGGAQAQAQQQFYPGLPGAGGGGGSGGGGGGLPPRPGGGAGSGGGGGGSISEARRQWQQQQQQPQGASGSYAAPLGAPLGGGQGSGSFGSFSNPLLAPVRSAGSGPGSRGGSGNSLASGGGSGVGVAGIMAREQTKAAVTGHALDAAFSDLRALMAAAAEMVELAERFRQQQAAAAGGGDAPGAGPGAAGGDAALDAETALALAAMGIVSPVTRASAGALYHQQLARQLADFLEGPLGPLGKAGGLLMLPDAYCLFNRARGTELVSPDDLVTACELFEQLGLPLRLRRFASGVVVVQSAAHTDAALCARIGELVRGGDGGSGGSGGDGGGGAAGLGPSLSASAVGVALGLPVTLAREALLVAEAAGVVCRDDGPEGLRFFRNFFGDPGTAAAAAALMAAG